MPGAFLFLFLAWLAWAAPMAHATGCLTVAAAADLKFAMAELAQNFEQRYPGCRVSVVTGSSGKFYQQIVGGAPFDLFFSADIAYPRKLRESGLAVSNIRPYAYGRLVVWSARLPVKGGLPALAEKRFSKIAIANPAHAPYGRAAQASLAYYGLLDDIGPKLVLGENVAHAAQFAQSGAADAAIIALALALAPPMQGRGEFVLVDERSHPPLEQGYVLLKQGANNPNAYIFFEYAGSTAARAIFKKYGFRLPDER
jgi:molybdate transport system substrate-binding protein